MKLLLPQIAILAIFFSFTTIINAQQQEKVDRIEKDAVNQKIMERKEIMDNRIQERKEMMKDKLNEKKEKVSQFREKVATATSSIQNAKEKFSEIKDQRRKQTVINIDEGLNNRNSKVSNMFLNHYIKLNDLVLRITENATSVQKEDANYVALLAKAEKSLEEAKLAISAQSAKTYNVTISNDQTVKADVSSKVQELKADLKKVKEILSTAKKDVSTFSKTFKSQQIKISPTVSVTQALEQVEN